MSWMNRADSIVQVFKWPAAISAALVTPLLAWSLLLLAWRVVQAPLPLVPFVGGLAVFVLLWKRWLGNSGIVKFLIVLEHESIHALFAFLTFHPVVGFRASIRRGGEVKYLGRGNWLITASPYFFPLAALLLFLMAYVLPFPALPWQSFLLGVALGYHVATTYRQTHRDQSDIQNLGTLFCVLFLPAANLAVVGLLVSFAHDGSDGLGVWIQDLGAPVAALWDYLTLDPSASAIDGVAPRISEAVIVRVKIEVFIGSPFCHRGNGC